MQIRSKRNLIFFVVLHLIHFSLLHHFHTISVIILSVGSNQDTKCMHGLRQTIYLSKNVLSVAYLNHQRIDLYKNMLTATLKGASISVFANLGKCKLSLYYSYMNLLLLLSGTIFKYGAMYAIFHL